jgi:hypothetical protein
MAHCMTGNQQGRLSNQVKSSLARLRIFSRLPATCADCAMVLPDQNLLLRAGQPMARDTAVDYKWLPKRSAFGCAGRSQDHSLFESPNSSSALTFFPNRLCTSRVRNRPPKTWRNGRP